MKRMVAIGLTMVMVLGMTSMTFANNGKGKGLATAPGQDPNFSKGITTVVTIDEKVTEGTLVDVDTSTEYFTEDKTDSTSEKKITLELTGREDHNQQPWYREIFTETTETTTATLTWDETTTVTTTTTTETPVTITDTTVTTVLHRGAPVSNGKVLSETGENTKSEVEGESVVKQEDESVVTVGEITKDVQVSIAEKQIKSEWIK